MTDAQIGVETATASAKVHEKTDGTVTVHIHGSTGWTEERLDYGEAIEIVDRMGNVLAVVEVDEEE